MKQLNEFVDMDFESFKKEAAELNLGVLNPMIMHLESAYYLISLAKDKQLEQGLEEDYKVFYAMLFRLEERIVYLKEEVNRRAI